MQIIASLTALFVAQRRRLAQVWHNRHDETGLSTLEIAVIALGLLVIAGLLVTAITAAVRHRIALIR